MRGAQPPWSAKEYDPPHPTAQEFPSFSILHGRTSRTDTVCIPRFPHQEEAQEIFLFSDPVADIFPAVNRDGAHFERGAGSAVRGTIRPVKDAGTRPRAGDVVDGYRPVATGGAPPIARAHAGSSRVVAVRLRACPRGRRRPPVAAREPSRRRRKRVEP
ncbi:hypothetical protein SGPA1_20886 [Streptomyces misionensis JCM 4497]